MPDTLTKNVRVIGSTVRERAAEDEMKVGGDVYERLEAKVTAVVDAAILRAKENGRKTILPQDI